MQICVQQGPAYVLKSCTYAVLRVFGFTTVAHTHKVLISLISLGHMIHPISRATILLELEVGC